MQLEEYFEFDNPNGIRIKGTRVNIEIVVYATREGMTPGQVVQNYPTLTLEQVHAALAYYYANRATIDDYIARQEAAYDEAKRRHEAGERPEVVRRLLKLKAERQGKVTP